MSGYRTVAEHLADELALLDLRIALLLERQGVRLPEQAGALPGLVVTEAEVANLLADPARRRDTPRTHTLAAQVKKGEAELTRRQMASAGAFLPLPALAGRFGLGAVDRLAILACLAVELERKYEKLFGFLHDDLTRRWPSADLVLDLAGLSGQERLEARGSFEPTGRLFRTGLLRRLEHPLPTGARPLELDGALAAYLTGRPRLPVGAVHGPAPDRAKAATLLGDAAFDQTAEWLERTTAPVILMHGPAGAGRRTVAAALCAHLHRPLWVVEAGGRPETGPAAGPDGGLEAIRSTARNTLRDAALQGAAVAFVGLEAWLGETPALPALRQLVASAMDAKVPLFLLSTQPWHLARELGADHLLHLPVPTPSEAARAGLWRTVLADAPLDKDVDPDQLAARFRFPPGRVHAAFRVARDRADLRAPGSAITMADLLHGCRAQSAGGLGPYATRVEAKPGWDRLVLPPDDLAQLHEFCDRVRHRRKVFEEWGFAGGRHRGLGFSALFHGASGTGKTLAAEIIAAELGIDAYKVDLSAIVSKYVGETEKNLARLFAEAEESQSLIFFDEADSLFNKRVQVKDAHDRYANIEINFLLQRMEEYDGLVVLATNRLDDLDEAFKRRLGFQIRFPMPDERYRLAIWQVHLPPAAPLADGVDLAFLAARLPLPGGNIRNIALGAAFLAAADDGPISMLHLMRAARREYEKMGRHVSEAEFGPYYGAVHR